MTEVKTSVSRHSMWNGVRPKTRVEQGWRYTCLDSQLLEDGGRRIRSSSSASAMFHGAVAGWRSNWLSYVCKLGPTPRLHACWARYLLTGSASTQWLFRNLDQIKQSPHTKCLILFGCFKKILSLGNKKMFVWPIILKNKNMAPTSVWVWWRSHSGRQHNDGNVWETSVLRLATRDQVKTSKPTCWCSLYERTQSPETAWIPLWTWRVTPN